uniref:Putative plant transposon protein domain-containing protein n=1 Tax=Solanum tuberosum TaxID=4113 RepID=M1DK78_SOLTU
MLCGQQSMTQWTKHSGKRYHKSLPYAHIMRETRVWLKVVMNCLILDLHYTYITRDRVCLVYALITGMELNIGAIIKSSMRKSRVHKEHMYAFGGLITKMCFVAGVPEENVDYMAPLYPAPVEISHTKGPDTDFGPTLTTAERHKRDELIMARMYGLEMLWHKTGGRPSTDLEIGEVNRRYLLNDHAKALLGIGPDFWETTENDISTDKENLRTDLDMESYLDEEIDPMQAGAEANGGDIMED